MDHVPDENALSMDLELTCSELLNTRCVTDKAGMLFQIIQATQERSV